MHSQVSGIGPATRSEMRKMVRSCILSRRAEEEAVIWSQTRRLTFAMTEASELVGSYQERGCKVYHSLRENETRLAKKKA